MDYWKKQDLAFIHKLKVVAMELSQGSNGIELAKYILGNAPILKKVTIYYSAKQRSVVRKLKRMKWVSNAIVVFEKV